MFSTAFALITLFNGQNLDGWHILAGQWQVADGAIVCTAPASALRCSYEADEYTLAFEYRRAASGRNTLFVNATPSGGGSEIRLLPEGLAGASESVTSGRATADEWIKAEIEVGPDRVLARSSHPDGKPLHQASWPNPQHARGTLRFEASAPGLEIRNIQAREPGFKSLFDGKTLKGWEVVGRRPEEWSAEDGAIVCKGKAPGNWLRTLRTYDNFVLRLEYFLPTTAPRPGANSGIYMRAPLEGRVSQIGLEVQLLDDAGWWDRIKPSQRNGSVYAGIAPDVEVPAPPGVWNAIEVYLNGQRIRTVVNGVQLYDARLDDDARDAKLLKHPLATRHLTGFIGLQDHTGGPRFRNIRIRELPPPASRPASAPPD